MRTHGHVQVLDLPVADRGQPAGPAVPAEVEGDHAAGLVQPAGHFPDRAALPGQGEPVRQHDARSRSPGRCTASIGMPSSVTRVSAYTTGLLIVPFCVTPGPRALAGPRYESLITGGRYVKIGLQIPDFSTPRGPEPAGS